MIRPKVPRPSKAEERRAYELASARDDDTPIWMEKVMPVITYRPKQPASMQLLIEVIA